MSRDGRRLCSLARCTRRAVLCDRYPWGVRVSRHFPPFVVVVSSFLLFIVSPLLRVIFFVWFASLCFSSSSHPSSSSSSSSSWSRTSSYPCFSSRLSSSSSSCPSFASFPPFSAPLSPSSSLFRPPSPHTSTFLLLLVISLPSSSPRFVFPSLRRPGSSNPLPLRRTSSSSTFLLLDLPPPRPSSSPPTLLLGSNRRRRWVRLPTMCYRCRSRYRLCCRCRHRRPFAGVVSSCRQVVVAATMWAVDAVWGLRSLGVGWGLGEEVIREKLVARFRDALDGPPTCWVPPCVSVTPIPLSSPPTSLWKGEGGVRLSSSRTVDG
jgi:hypothetical protein